MKTYVALAAVLLAGVVAFSAGCSTSGTKTGSGSAPAATLSYNKPGFVTQMQDGRLWVFREGAKELEEFRKHGELVQQVVRPGAGPNGITLKAPDAQTITDYLKAK